MTKEVGNLSTTQLGLVSENILAVEIHTSAHQSPVITVLGDREMIPWGFW